MRSKQALIDICKVVNKTLSINIKLRKFYSQQDLEEIAQNWSDSLCNAIIQDVYTVINHNFAYDIFDADLDPFCLRAKLNNKSIDCSDLVCSYSRKEIRCDKYEIIYTKLKKIGYMQICDLPDFVDAVIDIINEVYKPRNYREILEDRMSYDLQLGYLLWFSYPSIKEMAQSVIDWAAQSADNIENKNAKGFILFHYNDIIKHFKEEMNNVILEKCEGTEI